MERPSHIIFRTHHHATRLPFVGIALSLQFLVFWLFTHGLASGWRNIIPPDIQITIQKKNEKLPPPPPPPIDQEPVAQTIQIPDFTVDSGTKRETITLVPATESTNPPVQLSVGPDRTPVSIMATHTVPPYPPIARRQGLEGEVTLRLTVSTEGRVSNAEVVASSGREDMDTAARQWIVSHWTYKPALDHGAPSVGHTLATVRFKLENER